VVWAGNAEIDEELIKARLGTAAIGSRLLQACGVKIVDACGIESLKISEVD
jgi:hypothetical protein